MFKFLTNADVSSELWLYASSANSLICSLASAPKRESHAQVLHMCTQRYPASQTLALLPASLCAS